MDFICGGLAASGACIFSNPFDVLKTRMQLQGELQAKGQHAIYYKNVFHAGYVVAKNEGIRGLQKGLGVAMTLHGIRNFIRLGEKFDSVRNHFCNNSNLGHRFVSNFGEQRGSNRPGRENDITQKRHG